MRQLYGYFRSSAAFRVRIALNWKGLDYAHIPVNLMPGVSAQKSAEYLAHNPQGRVPLYCENDMSLSQSPAILEYLEDVYPDHSLLPESAIDRAYVRQIAALIGCDMHPLNNLSVLQFLKNDLNQGQEAVDLWYANWIKEGFTALEALLVKANKAGEYCFGNQVSLAEVYLVPQVWNARRFKVDLSDYPLLIAISDRASKLQAFADAAPENQPDAPK